MSRNRHFDIVERYRSGSEDFDDRGIIYIRHGEPTRRPSYIIQAPTGAESRLNETWEYDRSDGDLVFHFLAREDLQDYKLVESLFDIMGFDAPAPVAAMRRSRERLAWTLAAAGLIAAATLAWITLRVRGPEGTGSASSAAWRTSLALPDSVGIPTLTYGTSASLATLALSPRGDRIAFVGLKDGDGVLYLRQFDSFDAVRLTKTEGASAPLFSPDGTQLAFFARGRLWRIDLPGGIPVELGPSVVRAAGGSWGDDGQIVYTPDAFYRLVIAVENR